VVAEQLRRLVPAAYDRLFGLELEHLATGRVDHQGALRWPDRRLSRVKG
jgi:hypothetical protein